MNEPVRVNTRISSDTNAWLDKRSEETAISKSALINLAIENYRKETEVVKGLPQLLEKLKDMGIEVKI